jgi:transcriptional regulator with XRE-family HTH domain
MWRSSTRVVMERQGVTQAELQRRTGLSKVTVSRAYHGWTVSPLTSARIAKALDVPLGVIDPVAAQQLDGLVISGR